MAGVAAVLCVYRAMLQKDVVIPSTPMMAEADWKYIESTLKRMKVKTFVEWGSGSSTLYFAKLAKTYVTIEHNPGWCGEVMMSLWQRGIDNVKYICEPVTQGYRGWKGGWFEGSFSQFKQYVTAVDIVSAGTGGTLDAVLVDGRARLACAMYVMQYLNKDSIVFVHDFSRGPYKTDLEEYYTLEWESPLTQIGPRLGMLKPKPEFVG